MEVLEWKQQAELIVHCKLFANQNILLENRGFQKPEEQDLH